jgi:hypothetical protein
LDACVSATLRRLRDDGGGWDSLLTAAPSFEETWARLDARVRLLAPTWTAAPGAGDPVARVALRRTQSLCAARRVAEVLNPAIAADPLARIARLARPSSRRFVKRRRHAALAEAGVLFEFVVFMRALTEDLRVFFEGAGPYAS